VSDLFGVWTPATLIAAVVAGLGIGYFVVGAIARNPYFSSGRATPFANGAVAAGALAIALAAFYTGQVFGAIAGGDVLWARILSRFTLSLVYALFLGVGTWAACRRDQHNRHARARLQAMQELHR
jgi:hypothetical protein